MRNIVKSIIYTKYGLETVEYESWMFRRISSIILIGAIAVNMIFFTVFPLKQTDYVISKSLIFIVFSFLYIFIEKVLKTEKTKNYITNILPSALLVCIVLKYYPVVGATVWTMSFIVIAVSLIRSEKIMLSINSITLFFLGLYVWYRQETFEIGHIYYASQFVSFSVLFITAAIVYINNYNKSVKIKEQLKMRKLDLNEMEELNTALEEEIDEHQKTQAELSDSEKKYRAIVNAMPDTIFRLSREGRFLDVEVKDESQLISEKNQFMGKLLADVMPKHIADNGLEKISQALISDELQTFEYSLEYLEGSRYYEVRIVKASSDEVIAIMRNITELKKRQNYIEYLSYHDQLTGLYNRRFFEEELRRLDTERNIPFTIAMIDINGLKLVNDAFGHLAGDELLKRVSDIFKRECRSDDIIARIGGDEFVILLPKTKYECTEKIAKRIYESINQEKIENIVVSASIGWETKSRKTQSIKEVFIQAEEKMYRKKLVESQSMRNRTIQVILKTLNEKNERERVHSEKVSIVSKRIGKALNLDNEYIKELEIAGLMHDIGKISIDESLLNKPGKLTDIEYNEIKKHPESGYQILRSVDAYSSLAEYILCHHERWDGKGYPKKLKGEEIPLIARIIAVADAYEAMISDRAYRSGMDRNAAFDELVNNSGTQFDPKVISAVIEKKDEILGDLT